MGTRYRPNETLKMLLFKKQISQRQLAFETDIPESRISTLIKYGIGTPDIEKKVASYLDVNPSEVFRG